MNLTRNSHKSATIFKEAHVIFLDFIFRTFHKSNFRCALFFYGNAMTQYDCEGKVARHDKGAHCDRGIIKKKTFFL